ncbi:MAG: hypothetical protein A2508_03970 [Candidatus Lambdaproteobacteria bacterium RIFOXYD12_FULL_49_8]|uniref:ABC transmembrane type-1 domain-containing protein n=1 Tax=Candidatus Lambdaproteobacteria bacterium RIFOXYD2_FULL_50_16 TaxID=1817772 RepID=A0A1F6GDM8_9PROT|nr:MAG: hypothetical protein A2527_04390 [Candidatus Lambdaproteobacteria bacterium RIFOXYD2_FULL_50_16]OGG98310.1 MAG: hypothetical protein A2508_03970 [Candidatus Lambdaproteobacteria bacterium RIFOXYD12_FULL_49_8]
MVKMIRIHLFLMSLALLSLVPLWVMFTSSLTQGGTHLGLSTLWPGWDRLTLTNYSEVWTQGNFGRYFFNSVWVSFWITLSNLLFDAMAAYALARRRFGGRGLLMALILAKLMIPGAVLMVPQFILIKALGLYDGYLALILPMVAETFGIFMLRQYMLSLPKELEEAARLEGAGDIKIFFSIILPLCRPALAVVAIHSLLVSWNAYVHPLILTSSDAMRTLPLGLAFYRASHSGVDTAHLMAGAMIASLPVMIAFAVFQKQIISGLTQGAVKG